MKDLVKMLTLINLIAIIGLLCVAPVHAQQKHKKLLRKIVGSSGDDTKIECVSYKNNLYYKVWLDLGGDSFSLEDTIFSSDCDTYLHLIDETSGTDTLLSFAGTQIAYEYNKDVEAIIPVIKIQIPLPDLITNNCDGTNEYFELCHSFQIGCIVEEEFIANDTYINSCIRICCHQKEPDDPFLGGNAMQKNIYNKLDSGKELQENTSNDVQIQQWRIMDKMGKVYSITKSHDAHLKAITELPSGFYYISTLHTLGIDNKLFIKE